MINLRNFVRDNFFAGRSSPFVRLFVPALVLLLPLLTLGGSVSNASAPTPQKPSDTAQTLVLRVYFHDTAERDRLATELNAEEEPTSGGYLTVFGDRAMYSDLLARGVRVEIDQQGTAEINNPNISWYQGGPYDPNNPDTFYGGYHTVEEMQAFLNQQTANHPTLAQVVDFGDSWCKIHAPCVLTNPSLTWNGYDLLAIHITNQAIPGPKPVFWFDGAIHSREIAVPEIAMRYISYLLDGYDSDPDAHWLVDYHDIWVVPMLNPDGHHMVEYGGNSPIGQRKNANYTNGCTVWGSSFSQLGTDDNRNYPFQWGCCGGSSGSSCDQTYRGPSANSDPETQAAINQIRLLIPDQRGPNITDPAPITATGFIQGMHSNASLNLLPWGFQVTPHAPNDAELRNIGHHMQATNASPAGNGYVSGQPPEVLYAVDGDSLDWGYGELGAASYTTEIGGGSFYPSYSTIDSSLWPQNRGALIYEDKVARTPYLLSHGPDTSAVATNPMTVTQGTPSQLNGVINFAWSQNAFSQNVGAAEYYIDTPPWAGGTPIAMSGNFGSTTVPVQATVDTSSLSVGRHILFVRGRGVNDYQGFQTWGEISAAWLWVTASSGTPTPTSTAGPPTNTPTRTLTAIPTNTPTRTPTNSPTPIPPTSTNTPQPPSTPTGTNTPLPTQTPGGPSATPVPTDTSTAIPTSTDTPLPTQTPGGPTATSVPPDTATPTTTSQSPTATATVCSLSFSDVPVGSTFYPYIRCLACRGIINGYPDGTFRPNNSVTRGQLSKIVSNSAGFNDPQSTQMFQDVPVGSTFYIYIARLAVRGYINGYACGGPGEPCGPTGLPYFRTNNNATRAQISKIVSDAAGFNDVPSGQQFQDVAIAGTFYAFIYRLATRDIMQGYPCGSLGEPCVPPANLPYFRPNNNATRGETGKIVGNTFFPDCNPSAR